MFVKKKREHQIYQIAYEILAISIFLVKYYFHIIFYKVFLMQLNGISIFKKPSNFSVIENFSSEIFFIALIGFPSVRTGNYLTESLLHPRHIKAFIMR